ncbi:MAG: SigE family RNA polymerase sigma factor [Actinomycetota bacterium]
MERSTAMDPDVTESGPAEVPAPAGRLEDLYVRNAPGALRLAYFLTGHRELAEDLVQEAFVRVAGRFRHLRMPDAFDAYLRRMIVNLYTSQLRRTKLERAYVARHGADPTVASVPGDPAARDELWRALHTLPERQRAAIVLRFYEDLSEHQSAEILGCSTGALNQLIVRGMAALRTQIGDDER